MLTPDNDKRLFLLDAYALIFRGYYAFIKNPIINSKGQNTSAIMGFMNSLLDLLRREKPTHLAVVFDVGGIQTLRHDYFPEYKANRNETPEGIRTAVPYIQEILNAMHIPVLFAAGYEADDVIGTLSRKAEKQGYITYMMTPDKDYAQLVTDKVKMYKPASRGGGVEVWGIEEVKKKFGVDRPEQVVDYLGMMGDSVDNIPGIPGVGAKTAQKFIKEYGSLEGLYENIAKLRGKLKQNVMENRELAFLSKKLAKIITDAPVDFIEEKYTVDVPDFDKVKEIFAELEFRRLLENIYKTYDVEGETASESLHAQISIFDDEGEEAVKDKIFTDISTTKHHYQLVDSDLPIKLLIQNLEKQKQICVDCETTAIKALEAELVGIAFSYEGGKGYYVKFPEDFEQAKALAQKFKPILENPSILKIGQNLKYDMKVLSQYGLQISAPIFDTMVAHYVINPDMRHNLDVLAETYLNYKTVKIETLIGKKGKNQKSFKEVDLDTQTEYAVEDTDVTLQLKEIFSHKLNEVKKGEALLQEVEFPLVHVLAGMEQEGISLDTKVLENLSQELETDLAKLEKQIFSDAGHEFNINSPKQLGEILFEELKVIKNPKKTRTGQYSTSEDILLKIKDKHPMVEHVLIYRQLQKLKSTYVEALPKEINPKTGRVHTVFAQTVAATGRLASNNPNLQNIPIRTERGQEVRKAFVAKDDEHLLLAADYSQIELRLIAGLSGDEAMINSFLNHEDIHTATAAKIYSIPTNEVTRTQRSNAKTVNFGIIYGVSAFGLSEQTKLSRAESKDMIDAYFESYPMLKKYMDEQVALARKQGFVETILGRRRYLREINSRNHVVRSHAERNAVNAPIQGSAADIIKVAMVKLHKILNQEFKTKMLLQVHDELVFEVPKTELEAVQPIIKNTMENAVKFNVPLVVEAGVGKNWFEAH
ncbi:DNA polymerase I [Candidatus Ornithobacterium hominis]|uniref:DNA polymerase I n=1 Tax=Candidatus Ornithobacterium hominis TaxID=2497989 RepID=A0A383TUF0_9FLAO|nr:DNA polymerase I [Candidatus Ornithobacterium hominis]MCT7903930.1 DNA polymerase I [Candidatus Ornithobacterium hominis]SZD71274.1 DNA polymerase I [Candidatus Ornithobacterium hominis]